jgi:hypothetical protein
MDEPKDLVLEQLRAMRSEFAVFRAENHTEFQQVKARLTAIERQLNNLGEAVAAQWESVDNHAERLYRLEHPTP